MINHYECLFSNFSCRLIVPKRDLFCFQVNFDVENVKKFPPYSTNIKEISKNICLALMIVQY